MEIKETKTKGCEVISPEIVELLELQLAIELNNMRTYQLLASYFNKVGLEDLHKYFRSHAREEFLHYSSIDSFLSDNLVEYSHIDISKVDVKIDDSIDPFKIAVKLEYDTTKCIYHIYEVAIENQDYITAQWLMKPDGLIEEQSEEVRQANKALEIANMNLDWISKAKAIFEL